MYISDIVMIPDDTVTVSVTVSELICGRIYKIVAGGIDGSDNQVGPQFQWEMVTAGSCPLTTTNMANTMSFGMYVRCICMYGTCIFILIDRVLFKG